MKLQASMATEPRAGGREAIMEQRGEIERVIEDSASLRQTVGAVVVKEIIPARRQVSLALTGHGGAPRIDPARLGYTEAEVMGDWFPGAA